MRTEASGGRDILWPLLLVFVMFILATVYPATKRISASVNPLTISFFRYFFGVLPLLPFYLAERRRGRRRIVSRDLLFMTLLGFLGVGMFSICMTLGVKLSSASSGSLLTNSQPIFTTLLAPLIIGEDSSLLRAAGALAGVGGVFLIVSGGQPLADILGQQYFLGNVILVGGSLSVSVYSILLKRYVVRYGGFVPTFVSMLAGMLFLLVALLAVEQGATFAELRVEHLPYLLYIGAVGTALVYPLFNLALKANGVVRAVGFKLLVPVFAIALSVLLLGERPGAASLAGAAVVIASVALIQRIPARRVKKELV